MGVKAGPSGIQKNQQVNRAEQRRLERIAGPESGEIDQAFANKAAEENLFGQTGLEDRQNYDQRYDLEAEAFGSRSWTHNWRCP